MPKPEIRVVQYSALLECVAAYFDCSVSEIKKQKGVWEWMDAEGNVHRETMKVALTTMMIVRKAWGWLEDKSVLHIWADEKATPAQVLRVIAHELGHVNRPHHKENLREERKANKYARVAVEAFELMNDLIKEVNDV